MDMRASESSPEDLRTVSSRPSRVVLAAIAAVTLLAACGKHSAPSSPGASYVIANSGRQLHPLGRMTTVGNFPTGGHLSPDGRFYWSVSAGHGWNDVHIVDVASGEVVQILPIPGTYGQMTFSHDGTVAYVSGEPLGGSKQPDPGIGTQGDVIHVFSVDTATGQATEQPLLTLPPTTGGSARKHTLSDGSRLPGFPVGLALTPDDRTLVVALYNADQAAVIDVGSGNVNLVPVGTYPYAVGIERSGRFAYVSNAYDGTLSKIDIANHSVVATVTGLGGPAGDTNAQPQYVLADPAADRLYVAVTNHDGIAIVDTTTDRVSHFISLKRSEGWGVAPVAVALSPDRTTLYAANAGEDAVVSIALAARGNVAAYGVIGKIPTADYTSDVAITPDGKTLLWAAARGLGAGPNPEYGRAPGQPPQINNDGSAGPYPSYVPDMLTGRVGVVATPDDAKFAQMTKVVDASQRPHNATAAPAGTPLIGVNGGPSDKIKYVFLVVKENRTYDQLYGSDPRGDGDPDLEVLEDNGVDGPGRGTTPNQHALTRQFVLLDRFFEDSEVSSDGHAITTGAYLTNYTTKTIHADYAGRGRPSNDEGVFPISFPPNWFMFDQAVKQQVAFRDYGEMAGGAAPFGLSNDGRPTYRDVIKNANLIQYASIIFLGCEPTNAPGTPNTPLCAFDSGHITTRGTGSGTAPPKAQSRIDAFNKDFQDQLAKHAVPNFNYLIMPSNHTNGTTPGARDPLALVADNDLGVGQLVDLISHSSIWHESVIFVVEDDSQDGADHVDAHRAPALVVGPWVKHGGKVVHTRYDQLSVLRTIEVILGLQPLSVFDAVAEPMYDAFSTTADDSTYDAIQPEQDLLAVNPPNAANGELSAKLPFNRVDAVPQAISDMILWQRVHGAKSKPPAPGPNASQREHERAIDVLQRIESGKPIDPAELTDADDD
jgi:YVTN family beta-propeller protein